MNEQRKKIEEERKKEGWKRGRKVGGQKEKEKIARGRTLQNFSNPKTII